MNSILITTFYEFKDMSGLGDLHDLRVRLLSRMKELEILGTIIIAGEGFNGSISGDPESVEQLILFANEVLDTQIVVKRSSHEKPPFRKAEVKIKPEIVTLKSQVDVSLGDGTHVKPDRWNEVIQSANTVVLDARNDYEFRIGTFRGAVNPGVSKFSDLRQFVRDNLNPHDGQTIAMFCTGGIRCEKFAPYMKQLGFENVVQLEGGILRYLEQIDQAESLWDGECFVFDERLSLDHQLNKGVEADYSQLSPRQDTEGGST